MATILSHLQLSCLRCKSQGKKKKKPYGRPGQVDFPFGQVHVTISPSLPDGQGPRQAVHQLNFENNFSRKGKL